MRCSVTIPNLGDFADARTVAAVAAASEQAGWDGLFVWDHIAQERHRRAFADPWMLLTVAALATSEGLLDALVDDLLGDIDPGDPTEGDWRDGLVRVMDTSRRLLLTHPQLVPVFLARPGLGPNAARLGELTFALLRRGGVEGERAVEAFRVLLIYSLGFAAFQAPRLQVDSPARTEQVAATFASLPEDRFPQLRRLAGHLAAPTTDRHFHTGRRWLLDGIAPQPAD